MSRSLVVLIPHQLGKPEAIRRLKSGLADVRAQSFSAAGGAGGSMAEDRLRFRVSALGQVASGTIDVNDDHVRLDVMLPWLTALLADKRQLVIRAKGTLMLERRARTRSRKREFMNDLG